MDYILDMEDVHTFYGKSHILFGLSLKVEQGKLVSILGRNGAGKSTTLKSIIGLNPINQGRVFFKSKDITKMQPFERVKYGLGYVPEDRDIFPSLTVQENLELAYRIGVIKKEKQMEWNFQDIWNNFPVLKDLQHQKGGYLSGGEQQMLSIARTLLTSPDLLLLDEPCEGLAPIVVKRLGEIIQNIKETGCTILMSEQNIKFAFEISDYGYIIDKGHIQFQGSIDELASNEQVKKTLIVSVN